MVCIIFEHKQEWTLTDEFQLWNEKNVCLAGGKFKTLNFVYFCSDEHICWFPGLVSISLSNDTITLSVRVIN